jgi:ribosomal protein S18 acetylase RimI-like enzyme
METDISLRKAGSSDIQVIKQILLSSLRDYNIEVGDDFSVRDIDTIGEGDQNLVINVLLRGASVIGFVVMRPLSRKQLELKRLYLSREERGKGLGSYLLESVLKFSQRNGYQSIQLETTTKFYHAINLYSKFGFVEVENAKLSPGHDRLLIKTI